MNNTQRRNLTLSERMGAYRQAILRAQGSRQPAALKAARLRGLVAEANIQGMFNWQLVRQLSNTRQDVYGDRTVLLASAGHFGQIAINAQANTQALYWTANGGLQLMTAWAIQAEAIRQEQARRAAQEQARQDRQVDYAAWLVGAKGQAQWGRFATNAVIRNHSIDADSEWYSTVAPRELARAQRAIGNRS